MTDKEKRILKDGVKNLIGKYRALEHGIIEVLENNILSFIDSLQEETASEELEKAAKAHSNNLDNICGSIGEQTRKSFKAGAKWQKDRMMLNTIDATCFGFQGAALFTFRLPAGTYLVGSKVKVIVIKED